MIDQTITSPPTAPTSTDSSTFRLRSDGFVAWIITFITQILNAITQMNALEANVNAKEASTVYSADIATAAANFQGEWVSQGYTLGQSVSSGGTTYMCKLTHATGFAVTNTTYWQPTGLSILISGATTKTTPVDADIIPLGDSASSFALKKLTWANIKANLPTGANYLINGGFDYWNYATSQTTSGYGSDDRWSNGNLGSTKTHSMVNATDTERALFNSSKFSRTVVTSVAGAGNYVNKDQAIENVTKLAGKTVTISFWAKADSNKNVSVDVYQSFGTGGTPSALATGTGILVALTTTWQKKTVTIAIPSIVGKTLGTDGVHTTSTRLRFFFDAGSTLATVSGSLGQQSGTFDIAEVKLEEGSVATPWTPYEGEFGGEVQACERYLATSFQNGAVTAQPDGLAVSQTGCLYQNDSFVQSDSDIKFPVMMRTAPTISIHAPLSTPSVSRVRKALDGAIFTGATAIFIGTKSFIISGGDANNTFQFGYIASAEL